MLQYNFCTYYVLHTYKIKITIELGYNVMKVNILCYGEHHVGKFRQYL